MPNVIHDIIKLTGGIEHLQQLELEPEGQPMLTIKARRRLGVAVAIDVTVGDFMRFRFLRVQPEDRAVISKWPYQPECYWPATLDSVLRKRGYLEAAIHYHLQPT